MYNFTLCSCGVNTKYYTLLVLTYLVMVVTFLISNLFGDLTLANQMIGIEGEKEIFYFFLVCLGIIIGATIPLIGVINWFGLKYTLLTGFVLVGAGILLQNMLELTDILPQIGYVLITIGSITPLVSICFIAYYWFMESQWIDILCIWQLGRVIGSALAFLAIAYLFPIESDMPTTDEIMDRYSKMVKIYLALVLSSTMIIVVFLKSEPEGLERSKKQQNHINSFRNHLLIPNEEKIGGDSPFLPEADRNELADIASRMSISIAKLSIWNRFKIIIYDRFYWIITIGCLAPLAATGFGETYLLRNLKIFNIDEVV